MRIICRNFRCRQGEIDLIGFHEGYLVFVEVKYRTGDRYGGPEEAVGRRKQRRICAAADYYRLSHPAWADMPVRYDVVAVEGTASGERRFCWYRNAFPHDRSSAW